MTTEQQRQSFREQYNKRRQRYKSQGWVEYRHILPPEIHKKVLEYKKQLMKEFWPIFKQTFNNDN